MCTNTSNSSPTTGLYSAWVPYKGWRKRQAPFDSWDHACQVHSSAKLLNRLVSDCQAVFSARSTAHSNVHSTGSTYWISITDQPRCLLEQLAKAILGAHLPPDTRGNQSAAKHNSQTIGAEWWTLCIDAEDSAVGFHWDLDYEVEERCGVYRTPYAGTVTYLCELGAPTLILEKAPTIRVRGSPDNGKTIEKGWLSIPAPGKHIRFPGACLHGAPDLEDMLKDAKLRDHQGNSTSCTGIGANIHQTQTSNSKKVVDKQQKAKDGKRKRRVSLLVNVWLDGAPGFAAPLDNAIAQKLSPCVSKVPFSLDHPTLIEDGANEGSNKSQKRGRREFCWNVANCSQGVDCHLMVKLPLVDAIEKGSTLPLTFEAGQAILL